MRKLIVILVASMLHGCASQVPQTSEPAATCNAYGEPPLSIPPIPKAFAAKYPDTSIRRSNQEIQSTFRQNMEIFWARYQLALAHNPCLAGRAYIAFAIAPDGTVPGAELVESDLGDKELEKDLVQYMTMLRFPPRPQRGYHAMVYPITLTEPPK